MALNIDQQLADLIEKIIIDKHPEMLDDELSEAMNNSRLIEEAVEELEDKINTQYK